MRVFGYTVQVLRSQADVGIGVPIGKGLEDIQASLNPAPVGVIADAICSWQISEVARAVFWMALQLSPGIFFHGKWLSFSTLCSSFSRSLLILLSLISSLSMFSWGSLYFLRQCAASCWNPVLCRSSARAWWDYMQVVFDWSKPCPPLDSLSDTSEMERYILTPAASVPLDLGPFMEAEAVSLHGAKIGSFLEAGMPGTLNRVSGVCSVYVCTANLPKLSWVLFCSWDVLHSLSTTGRGILHS